MLKHLRIRILSLKKGGESTTIALDGHTLTVKRKKENTFVTIIDGNGKGFQTSFGNGIANKTEDDAYNKIMKVAKKLITPVKGVIANPTDKKTESTATKSTATKSDVKNLNTELSSFTYRSRSGFSQRLPDNYEVHKIEKGTAYVSVEGKAYGDYHGRSETYKYDETKVGKEQAYNPNGRTFYQRTYDKDPWQAYANELIRKGKSKGINIKDVKIDFYYD